MRAKMILVMVIVSISCFVYSASFGSGETFDSATYEISAVITEEKFGWGSTFDSATYEISAVITEEKFGWGSTFDSASYQISAVIESSNGSSDWSNYWEFYKIDYNRYNVFEPTINETDTFDVYAVYYDVYYSEPYDYLYDVFEPDEETVDTFDVYRVYYYAYYGEEP